MSFRQCRRKTSLWLAAALLSLTLITVPSSHVHGQAGGDMCQAMRRIQDQFGLDLSDSQEYANCDAASFHINYLDEVRSWEDQDEYGGRGDWCDFRVNLHLEADTNLPDTIDLERSMHEGGLEQKVEFHGLDAYYRITNDYGDPVSEDMTNDSWEWIRTLEWFDWANCKKGWVEEEIVCSFDDGQGQTPRHAPEWQQYAEALYQVSLDYPVANCPTSDSPPSTEAPPEAEPSDLCSDVDCSVYAYAECEDGISYSNPQCDPADGNCYYAETVPCESGCDASTGFCAEEALDPCAGVDCGSEPRCVDGVSYQNPHCDAEAGGCVFDRMACPNGCDDATGLCVQDLCADVDCSVYAPLCEDGTSYQKPACFDGECFYTSEVACEAGCDANTGLCLTGPTDPCENVDCGDGARCVDGVSYQNPHCDAEAGGCVFEKITCPSGCDDTTGLCTQDLCAQTDCSAYADPVCEGTSSWQNLQCDPTDGECYYTQEVVCALGCDSATGRCQDPVAQDGGAVAALPPSDGSTESGSPDNSSSGGAGLLLGGAALLTAGTVAAGGVAGGTYLFIRAARRRADPALKRSQPKEPQTPKRYRLIAGASSLRFYPGTRRNVTVHAEVSTASGGWARASHIPIRLKASPGFSLTQDQGQGAVTTTVIAAQGEKPFRGQLTYTGFTPQGQVIPPRTLALEVILPDYQVVTRPQELLIPTGSQKTLQAAGMKRTSEGTWTPVQVADVSFTLLPNETPSRVDVSQQSSVGIAQIVPDAEAFPQAMQYEILVEATFSDGATASTRVPLRVSPAVIQLEAEPASLQLVSGEQVRCRVTPYLCLPSGQKELTDDPYLHVEAPPGIKVTPLSAQGVLDLTVEAEPTASGGEQRLRVVSSSASGEVSVEIPLDLIKLVVKFI